MKIILYYGLNIIKNKCRWYTSSIDFSDDNRYAISDFILEKIDFNYGHQNKD